MTRKPMTRAEKAVIEAALASFNIHLRDSRGSVRRLIRTCGTPHGQALARAVAHLAKERAKGRL